MPERVVVSGSIMPSISTEQPEGMPATSPEHALEGGVKTPVSQLTPPSIFVSTVMRSVKLMIHSTKLPQRREGSDPCYAERNSLRSARFCGSHESSFWQRTQNPCAADESAV